MVEPKPEGTAAAARLLVRGVRKAFGATVALDGVDLEARAGEVHAVLGENGAGKSTLMGILGGALAADAGSVTLDGAAFAPRDPAAARGAGIAMVHQELSLCAHLSVEENVVLGREPARLGVVDARARRAVTEGVLARVCERGRPIAPEARVADLSPADQQKVEIARALADASCRVLILDEPTSSLAADDAERLFAIVRAVRDAGMTVLYISHFLEEVRRVADRYTVLRDGRSVASGAIAESTTSDLVAHMAGRRIEQLFPRSARAAGDALLTVRGVAGDEELVVRRGEVVGLAGLVGAGRTELLRAIFGLDVVRRGEVRVASFTGPATPAERLAQGVGMLSEDRKGEGLALTMSIADNVTLSKSPAIVSPRAQSAAAARWLRELGIRAQGGAQRVSELSGGNQQKVALARLLHHDVDVLLLDEPTRGIDVASKARIYEAIDALAVAGKAVLMTSSYVPELLGVCDRVAVMCRGRVGKARPASAWTEHAVLQAATGAA